ncbi:ATP-binding protein [Glaciecola petra]|uniref:histidine kinase n=1 Tax=Glaciecola petra TaxID=3075602 RepID=A0ABU2ZRV2_9ALTE|nr:ATP-binding protein [Aestuariibacter sp. P117]MDT0595365.1 tetratricopeptide repeat protein [Aestuariibacter sp. P117]
MFRYIANTLFFALVLVSTCGSLNAQTQTKKNANDSKSVAELESSIEQIGLNDSSTIPLMRRLVRRCWLKCPDKAEFFGQQALQLLLNSPNIDELALIAGYLPRIYIDRGDFASAQKIIDQFYSVNKKPTNANDYARVLSNQGIIYRETGQLLLARNTYLQAIDIYTTLNNNRAIGNLYNNLAVLSLESNDVGDALEYFLKALPLIEEHSRVEQQVTTISNIAVAYGQLKDRDSSEKYLARAADLVSQIEHTRKATEFYKMKASIYIGLGDYQAAEKALDEAKISAKMHESEDIKGEMHLVSAKLFLLKEDYENAFASLDTASDIAEKIGSSPMANRVKIEQAKILLKTNKPNNAIAILTEAEKSIKDSGQTYLFDAVQPLLASAYENIGEFEKSLTIVKKQNQDLAEKMENDRESRIAQLSVLLKQHEQESIINEMTASRAESQAKLAQEQIRQQGLIIIALFFAFLLISMVIILYQKRKLLLTKTKLATESVTRKNQMLSDISHELRTPLAALKLQVETLEYDLTDDPKQTYKAIHSKIGNLNYLINDVLQLSLADAGQLTFNLKAIMIKPFLNAWIENNDALAEERKLAFSTILDIPPKLLCYCDAERLSQVLDNIYTNSCKYTDKGGQIMLKVAVDNNMLSITFEDSAPGMSSEELAQSFDRLYRVDKSRSRDLGGSGLGLSISKTLINLHKGMITCDHSNLGGLKVVILLPLEQNAEHSL